MERCLSRDYLLSWETIQQSYDGNNMEKSNKIPPFLKAGGGLKFLSKMGEDGIHTHGVVDF